MPNTYFNYGKMSNWIYKYHNKNNVRFGYIRKDTKKNIIKRAAVIMSDSYKLHEYNFVKFLSTSKLSPLDIDIFYGPISNLKSLLNNLYNRGYRIFITTSDSSDAYSTFTWMNEHPEALFFNTSSSVSSHKFLHNMPLNFIRSAIPDNQMLLSFFHDMLLNLPELLRTSGYTSLYNILSTTPKGTFPFNKIIYIYNPSLYTNDYLTNIKDVINILSINVEIIDIPIIDELTQEAKFYLSSNTISNVKYISSTDKPLIIFNADRINAQSLLDLLDNSLYYDNFTIFGDSFGSKITTKFPFTAGFVPIANFSDRGYSLANILDTTELVNPSILTINNILSDAGNILITLLDNKINVKKAIELLTSYKIISNNYLSQQYLTVSLYQGVSLENNYTSDLSLIFKKHIFEFEEISSITSSDIKANYPFKDSLSAFEKPTNTYQTNKLLIDQANKGININNILDNNEYNHLTFYSGTHIRDYLMFLIKYYRHPLPLHLYNYFDVYRNIKYYDIPLINLADISLNVPISTKELNEKESIELNIQVPRLNYQTSEYYYDSNTEQYILHLTKKYEEVTYNSFNVKCIGLPFIILHLFNGHILRDINYDPDTNLFITNETHRGIAVQKIFLNWLEIKNEYVVGQRIINIATTQLGTVMSISSNKFLITVMMDGHNTPIILKQFELTPLFSIPV
jgi:hypothetical protein